MNKPLYYIGLVLILLITVPCLYYQEIFHPKYQEFTGEVLFLGNDIGSGQTFAGRGYGQRDVTLRLTDDSSVAISEAVDENMTLTLLAYIDYPTEVSVTQPNYQVGDIVTCGNMRIFYLRAFNERWKGEAFTCEKVEQ